MMRLALLSSLCVFAGLPTPASAQVCTETVVPLPIEEFDSVTFRDPSTTADGWRSGVGGGVVRLKAKANTFTATASSVGDRIFAVAAGDFNGDGLDDLIAQPTNPCSLRFLPNMGVGSDGEHLGFDFGDSSHHIDNPERCNLALPLVLSGDFDGDNDLDVLWLTGTNRSREGIMNVATLYENVGLTDGIPQFTETDVFDDLDDRRISWHWSSGIGQTIDWNGDGLDDLLLVTSYGTTNAIALYTANVGALGFTYQGDIIPDVGTATPIADYGVTHDTSDACPGTISGGLSTLAVADYDADGDYDIVTCSLSEERLIYWKQDNVGNWTRAPDISYPPGGCNQAMAGDFDADGDLDIAIARDGFTCNGDGGFIHLFFNDGAGDFIFVSDPVVNGGNDLDLGVALEIDGDAKGQTDIIAADGNNSGAYYQVIPSELAVYSLEGVAVSTVIRTADPNEAIVSITVAGLDATVPAGTTATYFVSNNDGDTWEELMPEELPAGGSTQHDFASYGTELRFRIELGAAEDTLVGDDIVHAPASYETPEIRSIQFSYTSVDRREYSRSSVAFASGLTIDSQERSEVVYSASFFFPGFEADLRAFDVGELSPESGLQRADTDPDAEQLFSVGELLQSNTDGTTRNLLVAYSSAVDGDTQANDLVPLLSGQLSGPTSNPTLETLLATTSTTEAQALVSFIRSGMSHPDDWKFYDVGHSSPIFVGPPSGDPDFFGSGYATFVSSQAARDPFLVIGANDGFLRGIDAQNGSELWGIVPQNLAGKLKQMRVARNGNVVYEHQFAVDGPIVVADVQDDASTWHTVALSGQAQGQGGGDSNYYFAVDVTDPTAPKALWEFTDPWDGSAGPACDGDPCETVCTAPEPTTVCSADCTGPGHVFQESSSGVLTFEAENYSSETNLAGGSNERHWEIRTDETGFSGTGHVTAAPDGINCNNNVETCGALMTFQFEAPVGTYRLAVRQIALTSSANSLHWGIDNDRLERINFTTGSVWAWETSGETYEHNGGEATLYIWMREDDLRVDKLALFRTSTTPSGSGDAQICQLCVPGDPGEPTCTSECVSDPENDEWPECGVGAGLKCCNLECIPTGDSCGDEPELSALGETWSKPAVGRVLVDGNPRWLAFFGSGYSNIPQFDPTGRSVYAVDMLDGSLVARWDFDDLPTAVDVNQSTLENTIPGGITLVDTDLDASQAGYGFVDRAYFGDLEGRLWKIDISNNGTRNGPDGRVNNWPECLVFDAGDPEQDGVRTWAPIVTTPAVALLAPSDDVTVRPTIYFGTGGDDETDATLAYRFYAIRDEATNNVCAGTKAEDDLSIVDNEWFLEGDVNFRFWTDPLVVGNAVYFASLFGEIDSVNPCSNQTVDSNGVGSQVYGRAITRFNTGSAILQPGESVLTDSSGATNFFTVDSKIRNMPTSASSTTNSVAVGAPEEPDQEVKVYFQSFSDPSGDNPGVLTLNAARQIFNASSVRIIRWREVSIN